ncbi:MAG: M20/M25/M40 family metallo-hydrolase [Actinocatenispora sp.]
MTETILSTTPARCDDDAAIALLRAMLGIASPSGGEQRLARYLRDRLPALGFRTSVDEVGNLVADIGTGVGPTVMLLSHLDTVDRPLPVFLDDAGVLHGRGAVDAKGPLAAMLCAAARRPGFAGTVRVIGAVEEEWLSRGGHHVARTQPEPDALIIGEPSGWSSVVLGYKGKIDVRYTVDRPPTHSTNPRRKASEVAVDFWRALLAALGPDLDHGSFQRPAATLRGIEADVLRATLDVDCRVPPGFDLDRFATALHAAAGDGELDIVRYIPAVRHGRGNPAARSLSASIRRHGGTPRPTLKTGTSDMNTVTERWSVPAAAYGPGDSSLDHGDDERISVDEFLRGVTVLAGALDELADEPFDTRPREFDR